MEPTTEFKKLLETSPSYFDEYGGSVMIFIFINILAIYLHIYIYTLSNMNNIRENWQDNRCRPHILPFAGLINDTGELSINEYTQNNLQYCAQELLTKASGKSLGPIASILSSISTGIKALFKDVQLVESTIVKLEQSAESMFQEFKQQMMRFIVPLEYIFIALRQMLLKMQGVIVTILYFILGAIITAKSALGAILQLCIMSAIAIFVALVIMLVNPFTSVIGLAMLGPFAIMETLIISFVVFTNSLGVESPTKLPKFKFPKPKKICFHPQTKIRLLSGEEYSIENLPLGSLLENGSKVDAVMRIHNDNLNEHLYKLGNVFVTGSHYVQHAYGKFIHVADHPEAIAQNKIVSDYYVCLITSDHKIKIDKFIFWDWEDDLFDLENN